MGVSYIAAMSAVVATCSACGARLPTAPTAPAPSLYTAALTVRVLTRGAERPIARAGVLLGDYIMGATDDDGRFVLTVLTDQQLHVDVRADGYIGFGADGAIANAETWTFYLAPLNGPAQ